MRVGWRYFWDAFYLPLWQFCGFVVGLLVFMAGCDLLYALIGELL